MILAANQRPLSVKTAKEKIAGQDNCEVRHCLEIISPRKGPPTPYPPHNQQIY